MQDAIVRARVSSELKNETEKVFDELGISTTEAIRMFLSQVKIRKGLPFIVSSYEDNSDVIRSADKRQAILDSLDDE